MKPTSILLATLLALGPPLVFSACAGGPDRAVAAREIGKPPTDYRSRIRRHLGDRDTGYGLKYEGNYHFADPVKAAFRPADDEHWQYGYAVTAQVTTPVRQTGQVHRRPYIFFFDAQDDMMHEFHRGDDLEPLEDQ